MYLAPVIRAEAARIWSLDIFEKAAPADTKRDRIQKRLSRKGNGSHGGHGGHGGSEGFIRVSY